MCVFVHVRVSACVGAHASCFINCMHEYIYIYINTYASAVEVQIES